METEDVLGTSGKELPAAKFTPVDYIIFSLMVVTSIGIGVISGIRSRSRATTQEYLLGSRTMSPVPVAFSLLGGAISAISLLGNPAEMYFFGTQLVMNLLGFIPGCLFISQVITPIFYQLKLVSITEYLQVRFESRLLRTLGTLCLLLFNFIYMGLCLYAPTLSLSIVTGLSTSTSILILGFVCTFYITIGGVKAVIYTDVLQTLILLIGMLLVVIICTTDVGGVGSVWSVAERGGRIILFDFNTSPYERHTFLSTVIFGFNAAMMHVGINQSAYQRFASVRTLQISKNLMMVFMLGYTMVHLLLYYAGLVAFASYWDCDPLTSGRIEKPDQIIPFLVINKLSHLTGVAGVFVAAVYSGVLSTLSSCGNSITCILHIVFSDITLESLISLASKLVLNEFE
ncbi:sodium-coupled monocarboxylate transporter 2 [Cherax quadricarinatus]|uniref:sodium-coupled monocarboxylate transporter 2 n=1 Tax=Cherax quadricarinatus TaxID=27406 RepID=UPI00387E93E4